MYLLLTHIIDMWQSNLVTIEDTKSLELLPLQSQVNVINRSQLLNIRSIGQGN